MTEKISEADALFKQWLADLIVVVSAKYAMTADEAQEWIWESYTEWRGYFDDGYSPTDAAHEDAMCFQDS